MVKVVSLGRAMAGLCVLAACSGPTSALPAALPTETSVPPTVTPSSYILNGAISAPHCLGGSEVIGANVLIRNERDEVIGAGTTQYTGDPLLLEYERYFRLPDSRELAYTLWDELEQRGVRAGAMGREDTWRLFGGDATSFAAGERNLKAYPNLDLGLQVMKTAMDDVQKLDPDVRLWDWSLANLRAPRPASIDDPSIVKATQSIFGTDDLSCHAGFTATVSPARFYQIKVGSHSGPTYNFDDLAARDFMVDLSLGGS